MASLRISQLDDETCERLRVRAVQHGVSIEEEARRIITRAVSAPGRIGDLFQEVFGPAGATSLDPPSRETYEPVDLEDSEETVYLLRSPKNGSRLIEAIAELEGSHDKEPEELDGNHER